MESEVEEEDEEKDEYNETFINPSNFFIILCMWRKKDEFKM
ncbi:MAG: hypothetical protein V3R86_04180 [Candidatus Hydrothermarchaeaceae archaeon]